MAENFCVEHQQAWFLKGKMKAYAHPIKDENGETIGWCNKPKAQDLTIAPGTASSLQERIDKEERESGAMSKNDWAEKDRVTRKSIERQTALNNAVEMTKTMQIMSITLATEEVLAVAQEFEAYLEGSLKPKDVPTPIKEVKQAPVPATAPKTIEEKIPQNVGELYTIVLKHFDQTQKRSTTAKEYIAKLGITAEELKDIPKAYKEIKVRAGW